MSMCIGISRNLEAICVAISIDFGAYQLGIQNVQSVLEATNQQNIWVTCVYSCEVSF